jgi:predicted nuclease of predicted toxin-antitoxin system
VHVVDVGLAGASDRTIWQYAGDHGFAIVTKDEDFHRFSILYGPPPRVVRLLRRHSAEIDSFLTDADAAFLALA